MVLNKLPLLQTRLWWSFFLESPRDGFSPSRHGLHSRPCLDIIVTPVKLIDVAFKQLQEIGILIKALICDQGASNVSLSRQLGVSMMKPFFTVDENCVFHFRCTTSRENAEQSADAQTSYWKGGCRLGTYYQVLSFNT